MKKSTNLQLLRCSLHAALFVATVWFAVSMFTIVSHAQSQGKVTADSVSIREQAGTDSEVIGSADKDAEVTINGQTTGSDGNIWYQVFVDAETLGYIRSDLVSITDGSTPSTLTSASSSTSTSASSSSSTAAEETPAEVTEVNPVSATVTGGQAVRVRSNASTTSTIVTTAESGLALTVTGTATGSDGKEWYQVSFTVNGSEITGFIRSDYVNLSEEFTVAVEEILEENTDESGAEQESTTDEQLKYEVALENGEWYLIDNEESGQYKIDEIFENVQTNATLYADAAGNVKTLKAVVIVLVIIIIILIAAITVTLFKAREAADAAYFAEAERENARRRSADRPKGSAQGKQKPASGGRQGERIRPEQPNASRTQAKAAQGQKQQEQRPVKSSVNRNNNAQKGSQAAPADVKKQQTSQNRRTRNFMTDDDEFEFEFLNWDGDDEK